MKRHPTVSEVEEGSPDGTRLLGDPPRKAEDEQAGERGLVLTTVDTWNHTLILTGELTHRSAQSLEVEIERLCEEGVTDITLDLRDLERIDPVGVAVIAFRCGLCEKRGYGVRLIRGPRGVQRAFEQAGVIEMLPFKVEDDIAAARLGAIGQRSLDACEQ
ncbi:MAG TPA: STAS domain-containing protein [Solirubrobacteraceae bacterium]|jgi:anti-anti-sigma factor|nr:STAS domain-containing protein [Solirubrobacteraceae bacterium]